MKSEYEMYFKEDFTPEEAKEKGLYDCKFCERCGMCVDHKDCECKKPK